MAIELEPGVELPGGRGTLILWRSLGRHCLSDSQRDEYINQIFSGYDNCYKMFFATLGRTIQHACAVLLSLRTRARGVRKNISEDRISLYQHLGLYLEDEGVEEYHRRLVVEDNQLYKEGCRALSTLANEALRLSEGMDDDW